MNEAQIKWDALAWANRIRAVSHVGPALDELPRGRRRSNADCPLARATGLLMTHRDRPPSAIAFMRAFDAGAFPELVAPPLEKAA